MRSRTATFVAIACGLAAAWGVAAQQRELRREIGPLATAVVARSSLARGERVTGDAAGRYFAPRRVPAALLPAGAVRDPLELAGVTLAAELPAGAIVTRSHFASRRPASRAPRGQRRIAVDVRFAGGEAPAVGGRVDVIAAGESGGGFAELVLAGAEVLDVAPGATADATGRLALRVTLRQAARLLAARAGGAQLAVLERPPNEGAAVSPVLERLRGPAAGG
jgi:Flp pilus assembly protein CpaB